MKDSLYIKHVFENAGKVANLTLQIGQSNLLREKSTDVIENQISFKKIQNVISNLKKTLLEYKKLTNRGKGISAVQIGIPLKIAVIFIGNRLETIINPKILKTSSKLLIYPEICMSANPLIAKITRPSWIEAQYFDELGNKKFWRRKGNTKKDLILNRVLEHEIDHMEGIINIDLVKPKSLIFENDPNFFKKARFEKI